ncbi:MAG: 3-hydroxyacyl-ACP dehydratase FabZ [Lautropia sp.]
MSKDETDKSQTVAVAPSAVIDVNEILRYLPHRYPFLLIDRVLELERDARIVALKNVTINEPFFVGHFPHLPVMPGVLVVEAMAQAAGILSFATMGRHSDTDSVYYFAGIDEARFKKPVVPGDQLRLDVRILRKSRLLWKFDGRALVDGKLVAEARLMCALRDIEKKPGG